MKSSGRNISLTSYDDLFSTEETRQADAREQIQHISLSELHPFKDHPFRVVDDDRMLETVESVKEYGVLVPAIARPLEDGGYEIVAGHRRKRACELAGLDTMPVIVCSFAPTSRKSSDREKGTYTPLMIPRKMGSAST